MLWLPFFPLQYMTALEKNIKKNYTSFLYVFVCQSAFSLHLFRQIYEASRELDAHVSVLISSCWNNHPCRLCLIVVHPVLLLDFSPLQFGCSVRRPHCILWNQ